MCALERMSFQQYYNHLKKKSDSTHGKTFALHCDVQFTQISTQLQMIIRFGPIAGHSNVAAQYAFSSVINSRFEKLND